MAPENRPANQLPTVPIQSNQVTVRVEVKNAGACVGSSDSKIVDTNRLVWGSLKIDVDGFIRSAE